MPDASATMGAACASCGAKLLRVSADDSLIGKVVDGRFKILERLGAGAMGVVYRATQLSIGRDVAVKIMTGMDATTVKRFFREAQIASALSHPNTVQIIEFGQGADGRVYLAMELVRGHTLLDEINDKGALASRRICRIGSQLCDALEAAHRQTIVHRDLKPENVMIAVDGTDHIKILDFGIARVLGDSSSRVTGVGLSAGTPNYMAPEVLGSGADPEPPQDMYAVGVILAELSLGRTVWSKTTLELLYVEKTTNEVFESVPARLRPLIKRLVDPDPAKRLTAGEARSQLRELDRVATDPVGIAPTAAPMMPIMTAKIAPLTSEPIDLELPPMDDLQVIDLGERTGAPVLEARKPKPVVAAPIEVIHPDIINVSPSHERLELDGSWRHEKAARIAGATPLSPAAARVVADDRAARRHNKGLYFAVVLFLAIAGAGAYLYVVAKQQSESEKRVNDPVPKTGVSIRIVGKNGTPVTIDGANAGKTPISLKRSVSKRAMVIGANGSTWKIIPDRDQTIDVTKP